MPSTLNCEPVHRNVLRYLLEGRTVARKCSPSSPDARDLAPSAHEAARKAAPGTLTGVRAPS